ncbi:MAG: O-antigen ligase family protein [Candidatus Pacebacteria bacterium]|nr:O-antigen ligase family protein [Candidatus Paceibacterota bacterium]
MLQSFKKINLEYLVIFVMAVFAGLMISIYNLSIISLLISILFILASFKYFNQVLLLLVLYLPFQVALNITSGIDLASGRVLILYLFAVWVIKSLAEKRFVIRFNLQTLLIVVFLVLAVFSMLQAQDTERAIRKILVFLSIFPLYFILTSLSIPLLCKEGQGMVKNKNNYIYKIVKVLILSGFLISLIGVIQFALQFIFGIDAVMEFWSKYVAFIFYGQTFGAEVLSNPSWLVNISGATVLRAISLFPDPHMFSFYLGLIIPIILSFVLFDKKNTNFVIPAEAGIQNLSHKINSKSLISFQAIKQILVKIVKYCGYRKKILKQVQDDKYEIFNNKFLYIVLFVMLLAELLTFSRGGYIGMIVGIGALIILSWKYLSIFKKSTIGLLFSIFLVVVLFTNQSIVNRFVSSFNFSEGSNVERIKNWQQGWEVFSDNILTGVGIGNYSIYLYPTIEYRTPVYAHNLYLDIGAEMGIFALFAWLLLIGVTVWQLYRLSRITEDNYVRALSLGLIGSLTWFSAHSFFDTPIYSPTILAIFIVIISLSVMILVREKHNKDL